MTKKDRLEKYLKYKGIKPTPFARALGISNSHVSEINTRKNNRTLYMAIQSNPDFSDCNTDWIDTGKGEMLRSEAQRIAPQRPEPATGETQGDYSALAAKQGKTMVVTHVYLPPREDQRKLLEIYEMLCDDQRETVMRVAEGLASALPEKSKPKERPTKDLPEKKSELK